MSAPQSRPTARQLRFLRDLAARTASTFVYPTTRAQASAEIARMRTLARRPRDRFAGDQTAALVYATAVHPHEVSGYGSSAQWRTRAGDADV